MCWGSLDLTSVEKFNKPKPIIFKHFAHKKNLAIYQYIISKHMDLIGREGQWQKNLPVFGAGMTFFSIIFTKIVLNFPTLERKNFSGISIHLC